MDERNEIRIKGDLGGNRASIYSGKASLSAKILEYLCNISHGNFFPQDINENFKVEYLKN